MLEQCEFATCDNIREESQNSTGETQWGYYRCKFQ